MLTSVRPNQLAAITAKDTAVATGKIGLFTNNTPITADTNMAALTEATFTGYAQKTLTAMGAPYIDPITGDYVSDGVAVSWQMTALPGQTIYGAFVLDSTMVLQAAELFTAPIPLSVVNQGLSYSPILYEKN